MNHYLDVDLIGYYEGIEVIAVFRDFVIGYNLLK